MKMFRRSLAVAVLALLPMMVAAPAHAESSLTGLQVGPVLTLGLAPGNAFNVEGGWTYQGAAGETVRLEFILPPASAAALTWDAPTVAANPGLTNCGLDAATVTAFCDWVNPNPGDKAVLHVDGTVKTTAASGSYTILAVESKPPAGDPTLGSGSVQVKVRASAVPALTVSPTTVAPGGQAQATARFTASTDGDLTVSLDLVATDGRATLGTATPSGELTDCTANGPRSFSCTWHGAVAGQVATIAAPIVIDPSATPGSFYARANVNGEVSGPTDTVTVRVANEPTPTPTTTSDPGDSSGLPTSVPAGDAPLDEPSGASGPLGGWLLIGMGVLAATGLGGFVLVRTRIR